MSFLFRLGVFFLSFSFSQKEKTSSLLPSSFLPQHQRPDPVRVPERHQPHPFHQSDTRIRAFKSPHRRRAGLEQEIQLVHVGVGAARVVAHEGLVRPVDLVGKHVQQHLRVALRAQVPGEEGLRALQSLAELLGVRQIAVVDQIDAERGVYEKRLRLCCRGRARRGVPDVAQAHRPLQGVDRLLVAEDVGDEAVGLVLVELGAVDLGEEIFFFFLEEKERMRIRVFFLDDVRKREGEENQKKTSSLTVTMPAESCPRCWSIKSPS